MWPNLKIWLTKTLKWVGLTWNHFLFIFFTICEESCRVRLRGFLPCHTMRTDSSRWFQQYNKTFAGVFAYLPLPLYLDDWWSLVGKLCCPVCECISWVCYLTWLILMCALVDRALGLSWCTPGSFDSHLRRGKRFQVWGRYIVLPCKSSPRPPSESCPSQDTVPSCTAQKGDRFVAGRKESKIRSFKQKCRRGNI